MIPNNIVLCKGSVRISQILQEQSLLLLKFADHASFVLWVIENNYLLFKLWCTRKAQTVDHATIKLLVVLEALIKQASYHIVAYRTLLAKGHSK